MKIWGDLPKIFGIDGKQKAVNKIQKTTAASKKDVVSISGQAKDLQVALKALKDVPDIRKDKVDILAEKYGSGTYNVSGRDVADSIIRSVLDKKV